MYHARMMADAAEFPASVFVPARPLCQITVRAGLLWVSFKVLTIYQRLDPALDHLQKQHTFKEFVKSKYVWLVCVY